MMFRFFSKPFFRRATAPLLAAALLVFAPAGCSDSPAGTTGTSQNSGPASGTTGTTGTAGTTPAPAPGTDPAGSPSTSEGTEIVLQYGDVYALEGDITVDDPAVARAGTGTVTAVGVGRTRISAGGQVLTLTVSPAVVDVVLFTGQSNMVGRETSRYKADIPAGQAYEFKYLSTSLTEVRNPVGETFGEVEISSGSSIVPRFCADYVAATGRKIVAVHAARGGRAISSFDSRGGAIYPNIIDKYSACIAYLEENPNFTVGHRFYLMYQGESDSSTGTSADVYKSRYNRFHNGLVKQLGMEFGALISSGRNTTEDREGILRIQQAKEELAAEKDDLIYADYSAYNWYIEGRRDCIRDDLVHLNAAGLQAVADEACKNIVNYMGLGDDPALAGVDPVTYLKLSGPPAPAGTDG